LNRHPFHIKPFDRYFLNQFRDTYNGSIDTWDFQWVWTIWKNGGYALSAPVNLVENIGFSLDATHTKFGESSNISLSAEEVVKNFIWEGKILNLENMDCVEEIQKYKEFQNHIPALFPNSRCHFLNQGGHCDAGFAVLGPGRLLTTQYYEAYADCFRGWQLLNISQPEFHAHGVNNGGNGRWWVPELYPGPNFNQYLLEFAADWVGNYRETFFECNCVLIDERNIVCIGTNEGIFERLHQWGFNVHVVPFRTRTFWDGGLHCCTLDIRRANGPRDYFAELTEQHNH
jgi:hypothetical protein